MRQAACRELEQALVDRRFGSWSRGHEAALEAVACRKGVAYECARAAKNANYRAERVSLYVHGCDLGDGAACQEAADAERHALGVPRNDTLATRLYRHGCELRDAEACRKAGDAERGGLGTPRSDALAEKHYEQGCDLSDAAACSALAGALDAKRESQPSYARADFNAHIVKLYTRACTLRYALACSELAGLYAAGQLPARDAARALVLAKRACELDKNYCASLEDKYGSRWAARKDLTQIIGNEEACEHDDGLGCAAISKAYAHGELLPKDSEQAAAYRARACSLGFPEFCSP